MPRTGLAETEQNLVETRGMADRRSGQCDRRATWAACGSLESRDGRIGLASAAIDSDGRIAAADGRTFASRGRRRFQRD